MTTNWKKGGNYSSSPLGLQTYYESGSYPTFKVWTGNSTISDNGIVYYFTYNGTTQWTSTLAEQITFTGSTTGEVKLVAKQNGIQIGTSSFNVEIKSICIGSYFYNYMYNYAYEYYIRKQ